MESGALYRRRVRDMKDPGTEDNDEQDGDKDTDHDSGQRDGQEGDEQGGDEQVGGSNVDEQDLWRGPQDKPSMWMRVMMDMTVGCGIRR